MTINLTAKDIGKQYRITATAMIDRSGLEVTDQPAVFRGPTDGFDWYEYQDESGLSVNAIDIDDSTYAFDIPVDILKLALPEHVMEFLDEEFKSEEQPDTHRVVYFFLDHIDSIEESEVS